MLLGEFRHTLDPKNRLAIPAKFRAELHDTVVLTRGIERCLTLYSLKAWEKVTLSLDQLIETRAHSRAYSRHLLSGAFDTELDGQGRVLIPDNLKSYARLNKDLVVVGLHTRVEIWSAEAWQEYRERTEGALEDIAESLSQLGMM